MNIKAFIYYDGIPTLRDSDLIKLYDKMEQDGTAEIVFPNGPVADAIDFVTYMKQPDKQLYVAYDDENPLGFGWLNNFENHAAEAHFCVFSEAWHRSVEIGKALVESAMDHTGVNMLIGNVPKFNEMAAKFVTRCGGHILGELPLGSVDKNGNCHPTIVVYYVR